MTNLLIDAEEWRPPNLAGVTSTPGNGSITVHIERDGPVYICLRRTDHNFRTPPPASSFAFFPGSTYAVNVAATVPAGMSRHLVIVEYDTAGDRVFSTKADRIVHAVAPEATALTLALRLSGRGTITIGETQISPVDRSVSAPSEATLALRRLIADLVDFVSQTPSPVIVFYTGSQFFGSRSRINHRTLFMARECARQGIRVVLFPFPEVPAELRQPEANIRQYGRSLFPVVLDALTETGCQGTFVCGAIADTQATTAMDLLKAHGWSTVFEALDDMEEFRRAGFAKWYHPRIEERVCRQADRVIAVNQRLAAKIRVMGARTVHVVGNGVDPELVGRAAARRQLAAAAERRTLRRVGFIGHLTAAWFDWPALVRAAAALPDVTFELIGEGEPAQLSLPGNVAMLGPKSHEEYFDISAAWSVGIVPFRFAKIVAAMDPLKIYEYLATGLRIAAPEIGELPRFPRTYVYGRGNGLEDALARALREEVTVDELAAAEALLTTSTWPVRTAEFLRLCAEPTA